MGLMNVLACFMIVCIVGAARGQSVTVDTSNLCSTYQYRVHWNGWTSGQTIQVSSNLVVGTSFFTFDPTTAEGYADWYLVPSAKTTVYSVRLIGNDSLLLDQADFSADPCQNLRTFGLTPELQAVVVLNYHRANNTLSPVYFNGLLQTVAGILSAGDATLTSAFETAGRSYDGTATGIVSLGTAFFDAGSLLQSLLLSPQRDNLMGQISEIGFGYNQTHESWTAVAGRRTRVFCSDKFVAGSEQCDDGNLAANDGCATGCTVEEGWTCTQDILQEGSVCTRDTPADTPSDTPAGPHNTAPATPVVAQNRGGSVTKEAGTLALLLALIAVVLSF